MRIRYAVFLLLILGCGDKGPALVQVKGTVTLDGAAVPFKNVRYVPQGATVGVGAGGNTDAEGRYSLIAVRPGALRDVTGVPPGAYLVVINEPLIPVEAPAEPATPEEGPAPAIGIPMPKRIKGGIKIPAIYNDPATTSLKVEVPAQGGEIHLEMKSKTP